MQSSAKMDTIGWKKIVVDEIVLEIDNNLKKFLIAHTTKDKGNRWIVKDLRSQCSEMDILVIYIDAFAEAVCNSCLQFLKS